MDLYACDDVCDDGDACVANLELEICIFVHNNVAVYKKTKTPEQDILSYMLIEQTEENGDRERWELMVLHLWLQWFVKEKKTTTTTILFKIEGKE